VEAGSGSVSGEHRVGFQPTLMGDNAEAQIARVMHRKYLSAHDSGLKVNVEAKGENNLVIEVERDPKPTASRPVNQNP
jgi:hypothetical protein